MSYFINHNNSKIPNRYVNMLLVRFTFNKPTFYQNVLIFNSYFSVLKFTIIYLYKIIISSLYSIIYIHRRHF